MDAEDLRGGPGDDLGDGLEDDGGDDLGAGDAGDARDVDQRPRLSGSELLALQLVARGYAPEEVAALMAVPVADAVEELRRAARALGAASLGTAVAAARRQGLIV